MDADRFDVVVRALTQGRPRRSLTRSLAGILLAGRLASSQLSAAGRKKKKKKGKKKKGGAKKCSGGTIRCGRECVDLKTDTEHCGSCDKACEDDQQCLEGECYATCFPACIATEVCCFGECSDRRTDAKNCGECGTVCGAETLCCAGRCTNVVIDRNNCGACDRKCGPTELCRNRQCGPCEAPLTLCTAEEGGIVFEQCVDLQTDRNNCGSCNNQCRTDQTPERNFVCQGGQCVCTGNVCPDGRCCPADFNVCNQDGGCCPTNFHYCGNGRCCPNGYTCGGTCGQECCA